MKYFIKSQLLINLNFVLLIACFYALESTANNKESHTSPFYSFSVTDSSGKTLPLSNFKNKTVMIVNVASRCGYTSQYDGLQALYKKYEKKGFVVLGFPSNEFAGQEPGTDQDIQKFCKLTYGVTFPVLSKVIVNGNQAIPLYKWLTQNSNPSGPITWNFNKFLINKKGEIIKRYDSAIKPEETEKDLKKIL